MQTVPDVEVLVEDVVVDVVLVVDVDVMVGVVVVVLVDLVLLVVVVVLLVVVTGTDVEVVVTGGAVPRLGVATQVETCRPCTSDARPADPRGSLNPAGRLPTIHPKRKGVSLMCAKRRRKNVP